MKTKFPSFLSVVCGGALLFLMGCGKPSEPVASPATNEPVAVNPLTANLSRDEALKLFHARATKEETENFEKWSASKEEAERNKAAEMVLTKLNADELMGAGIVEMGPPDGKKWMVVGSADTKKIRDTITEILAAEHITVSPNCHNARCGWYVERGDFFRAIKVLKAAPAMKEIAAKVIEPKVALP